MTALILTGDIPDKYCPKCGAPLQVKNKRSQPQYGSPRQFVGCSMFYATGCNYVANITDDVRARMATVREELDAITVDF